MNDFMSNLISGLSTTLIGMLIVFFGLLVLIVCITVMHKVMNPAKKQAPVPEAEKVVVPPREAQPAEEEPEEDDGELIAVIAAAVAAVWDKPESGPQGPPHQQQPAERETGAGRTDVQPFLIKQTKRR